jgi:LTXXQ motif family protein
VTPSFAPGTHHHRHANGIAEGHHRPSVSFRGKTGPRNFAQHRRFAHVGALRPFLERRWHRHHHLGWVGPLFWPYAYGDVFYYALWPYDYYDYDPFWAYGYGDIYEGIFPPYDYSDYVSGPQAPARMTALTKTVAQSCVDEAAEVTGWPIDQIEAAVKPNQRQNNLLDGLGNAVVKASDAIRSHCPSTVSFTPTGRLAEMQQRLEGLVQAVDIVQPPLSAFYDSLTDEQKARFNAMGAPGTKSARQGAPAKSAALNPQARCSQEAKAWPGDRIERMLHPNDAQHAKLDALNAAAAQAADTVKAACPSQAPATPPDRLAAAGKRLKAMLAAVQAIRPKLDDFYNSLSDEQKARFDKMGRQLFAKK